MSKSIAHIAVLLCASGLLWSNGALAGTKKPHKAQPARTEQVQVQVNDLSERFIDFYNAANKPGVTETQRWKLWRTHYGFGAVPPGQAGEAVAQAMLADAWPRYPAVMDRIVAGYGGMRPSPERQVRSIADLLKLNQPLHLRITAYVGFLEGNAFTLGNRGEVRVAIPLEDAPEHRAITAAHELTHAVHIALGALDGDGAQSVAAIAISEGLAMHVSRAVVPGARVERYVEFIPGWFRDAEGMQRSIYESIRPQLAREDADTVGRLTQGHGNTGLEREAYYVGWKIVELWLAEGRSFAQIARIPPTKMASEAGAALARLLAKLPPRDTSELKL
ncbi:DUF2268 domain-containing putative Zn-dependent protease [Niveibacterium microcysteis]|uniref:DUF2268 domain-containing protein n=1 Tax=Niveibacterium microcysteis TaxID=2811415 RepID=A0ABX7MAE8_9RHOO|nr:DUF2268 domain-containing putative Zn-dependent protease [Niveibacterium microcysteis]QSI78108.1 hypothetical protein JY500_05550 [Niveibacterium microcysteis]